MMTRFRECAAVAMVSAVLMGCLSGCTGNETLQEFLFGKPKEEELLLKESISTEPAETEPGETSVPEEEAPTETEPEETTVPQKVLEGEIIANTLNIREEPGTDSKILGSLGRGDHVTITERKKVGDMYWGKTEQGWISMTYVGLEGEVEGSWYQLMEKDEEAGKYSYRVWEFDPEGNFLYIDYLLTEEDEFDHVDEENDGGGSYTLEEEKLTLRFNKGEKVLICGEEQRVPGTKELSVQIDGATMKLEDKETWNRGSLESIQDKLKQDLENKRAEESKWIRGTWRDIKVDKEEGIVHLLDTWTFKKDGTFEYVSQDIVYTYSEEDGLAKDEDLSSRHDGFKGTYQVEDNVLTLDYTYEGWDDEEPERVHREVEAVVKKGKLQITDDSETFLYTGETLEDYVEQIYAG